MCCIVCCSVDYSDFQCVSVRCSVLQCVLQYFELGCSVCCGVLTCVAMCCNVLHCVLRFVAELVAVPSSALQSDLQ